MLLKEEGPGSVNFRTAKLTFSEGDRWLVARRLTNLLYSVQASRNQSAHQLSEPISYLYSICLLWSLLWISTVDFSLLWTHLYGGFRQTTFSAESLCGVHIAVMDLGSEYPCWVIVWCTFCCCGFKLSISLLSHCAMWIQTQHHLA